MKLFDRYSDITDGIESNVWRAIDKSITKNSFESFRVLKSFVRRVLQLCIRNNSIKHFQKYVFFPAYYYDISYEKAKRNTGLSEIHKYSSEEAAKLLKGIITFDIKITHNKTSIDSEESANIFYYWAFHGFSRLFFGIIKNTDTNQFRFAMNEYENISESDENKQFTLKWEIIDLIRLNINGLNDKIIKRKKEKLNTLKQFNNYKRHVLIGIKYWVFFLYKVNKIENDIALDILKRIKIPHTDSEDLLNDILFFRGNEISFSYMGWNEWDFTERQSGKVYSPPQPHYWLTLGFFADQIRDKRYFVNFSELDSEDLFQASFLYNEFKKHSDYFEKNFEKWKNILLVDTIENYKYKSSEILKDFAMIKRKKVTDTDRAIALAPIHQPHVESFKTEIGIAWKSQARIHRIFKYFSNTIDVSDQEIKLKQIGQRTFFEKAKMMFTEENYQPIYGVDNMGGEIGRWEDDFFLNAIRQADHNRVSARSILEALNKCIYELKTKEKSPNFILISYKYSNIDDKFLKSEFFKSKLSNPIPENDLDSFFIGTFDGIPVYTSFSESLNNLILVCNFNEAFQQLYKTNESWFEKELTVDVQLVTDEIAQNKLTENRAKWTTLEDGANLTDEEALLLIKTSIIIDIWTTVDYQILDKESYVLGYIKTESEE
jgi:hypothetical protein